MKRVDGKSFIGLELSSKTVSDVIFYDCVFENCSFDSVRLDSVSFTECRFIRSRIVNPTTRNTKLNFSRFIECNLIGVHLGDLSPIGSYAAMISELRDSTLKYSSIERVELRKFNFESNALIYSTFNGCDLKGASFRGTDLCESAFMRCDLRACDFTDSRGFRIDVKDNKLEDASFSYPEVTSLLYSLGIKIK